MEKMWDSVVNTVDGGGQVMGDGCCSVACAVRCGEYVSKCVNKGETIGEIDLDFGKALSPVHQQFDVQGCRQPGKYKLLK